MSRLQNYLSPEFLASGLNKEFFDFITNLTQSKSKTEEASHVAEEIKRIKLKFSSPDISSDKMKDYLVRLIHCFVLGYSVDFSIIYAIMATQSGENAFDKRVGYLACTLFLKQDHELGIMLINTLQRDLKSQNYLDNCAALNAICYLEHTEMLDNVLDFVIQAMEFPKQIVRKKAVMALYCLYDRSSMNIKRIEPTLRKALFDKDTSVVFAALSVWKMIVQENPTQFKDILPTIHTIHRQIMDKKIHKSFMYHGVLAPWAQLDCLKIYGVFHDMNIGSPQDFYTIVSDCLKSMEKKVDAGFAITLECIRLLSLIDSILLESLSDDNPFDLIDNYLNCSNHNLKYLGLLSLSYLDESFWKEEWLGMLGEMIGSSGDDGTLVSKILEILEGRINLEVLKVLETGVTEALSFHHESTQSTLAYWWLNRLSESQVVLDGWYVESVLSVLAEARKSLDESFVQSRCDGLKEELSNESNGILMRESAVNVTYRILLKNNVQIISPVLVQFSFWILGEFGYLSSKYNDSDFMKQIQKYIKDSEDDYLQIYGLQAIKNCICRSKGWLSGLETVLKRYVKSPIPEKQEISRELILLIEDTRFEKELEKDEIEVSKLSVNPNRPDNIGRFRTHKSNENQYLEEIISDSDSSRGRERTRSPTILNINNSIHQGDKKKYSHSSYKGSYSSSTKSELVSSLIELELQEKSDESIDTQKFGELWLNYSNETKRRFECSTNQIEKLAKKLSKSWTLKIIELIGQEFIAVETMSEVLIHIKMLPKNQFELTLRSKNNQDEISAFLSKRRLT